MELATVDDGSAAAVGVKHARDEEDLEYEDDEKPRAKGRKRAKQLQALSSNSKAGYSNKDDQSAESSGKKQRMPQRFRKVRGRFGLLEKLAKDVPLDVVFEIFCYLDPGDLLRLARTSKDLRGILMSKSSERIWRTAREGVKGLPPLPDDLNEPQYAHLLFESYCHICNHNGRCDNILWSFRMRCCRNCALETFPTQYDSDYKNSQPTLYRYEDILPWEEMRVDSRRDRYPEYFGNYKIAARFKAEFDAIQTPEDRSAWIALKTKERRDRVEHAFLCEAWHQSRLKQRTVELNDIRTQRRQDILDRLEQLGLREEAEIMMKSRIYRRHNLSDEFSEHKLVKQSKKLTGHGWNSIKDELVQMLSNRKMARLAEERQRILSARYFRLQHEYLSILKESDLREPYPSQGDILGYPFFENLIWDTPFEEDLTTEFFRSKLQEHLSRIVGEWRSAKIQDLLHVMRKAVPTATASDLRLATSIFHCDNCKSVMQYPQMFYHHCCCSIDVPNDGSNERMRFRSKYGGSWSSRSIAWSDDRYRITKMLVEASSLDPTTATTRDINAANPLIECTACENKGSRDCGRLFMRWPDALTHDVTHAQNFIVDSFGEDTQKIIASEPSEGSMGLIDIICCVHCNRALALCNLVPHLISSHEDIIDVVQVKKAFPQGTLRKHWYWNPRFALRACKGAFRYKPPAELTNSS